MKFWQRILLILLSAGLSILVFPTFGLWWLAIIAWIPLLLSLRDVRASHGLYLGLLHGIIFYAVTLSWLVDVFRLPWYRVAPLILIMALFTAVFSRGVAVAWRKYDDGWRTALFTAVWWTGCEFFRSEVFYLKFPWMTPGLGLGPTWISPLLGVSGASFLLILGSVLCVQWKHKCQSTWGVVLLLVMLGSAIWQTFRKPLMDSPLRVLAVQNEVTDIDRYIELTRSAKGEHDLIVWPEHAFNHDVRRAPRQWQQLKDLAREKEALIVVGTHTPIDSGGWYNTALTLNAEGTLGEHYKNHPVHFFDDGEPHTDADVIETHLGKIGTPICFDCDYQDVIRRMVKNGAELLAIPSMDAISWGEKEHYQHAELVRQRAAENGRWLVVGSSSGVTQIIDPYGNRVASIPIVDEGVLSGHIGKRSKLTIYSRFGWLFPWIVMYAGAAWILVIFTQNLIEKKKRAKEEH